MTDEAKKVRAAYLRAWRKKNPQKVKDAEQRYWEKIAAQQRDFARQQVDKDDK